MSLASPIVLVVEDEQAIRQFVRSALEAEGWQVHAVATLREGLMDAATRRPDLIIADLGLPDGDGIDLIRGVRGWSETAIIVLSARSAETEKIAALDAGADDFLTKPFGIGELLARTRASLRRTRGARSEAEAVVRFGDVEVDLSARVVRRAGQEIHLTPIEYRLLGTLIANAGRVLTHRMLLREVWGPGYAERTHYLRVHMGNLRQKLEHDSARPRHLLTEVGVGYRLVAD